MKKLLKDEMSMQQKKSINGMGLWLPSLGESLEYIKVLCQPYNQQIILCHVFIYNKKSTCEW